jgi:hypothetical protein
MRQWMKRYRCVAKNPRGETDGTIKIYRELISLTFRSLPLPHPPIENWKRTVKKRWKPMRIEWVTLYSDCLTHIHHPGISCHAPLIENRSRARLISAASVKKLKLRPTAAALPSHFYRYTVKYTFEYMCCAHIFTDVIHTRSQAYIQEHHAQINAKL